MYTWLVVLPIAFLSICFLIYLLKGVRRRNFEHEFSSRDPLKGHRWASIDWGQHGHYCVLCDMAMTFGLECDQCGLCVDEECYKKKLSEAIACKPITLEPEVIVHHHWVKGNLTGEAICTVCAELCGDGVGAVDRRCALCQRCVHDRCLSNMDNPRQCDYGHYRDFIIPPNHVTVQSVGGWKRKEILPERVRTMEKNSNWAPLIVLANPKSGSGEADLVLQCFRRVLNPVQVVNLARINPDRGLRWCATLPSSTRCRILVAGGDGTVNWVLETVDKMKRPNMEVALISIGTGNDLSRTLGWGSGHSGAVNPLELMKQLEQSRPVQLDRWHVHINNRRHFGVRPVDKVMSMSNYLSVGVDAAVTLAMQTSRNFIARTLSSRFLNKFLFFTYGTRDVLEHACENLQDQIEVTVDDVVLDLPQIEGLVVLNIPCWGGGVRPWKGDQRRPQRIDDRKFEIFAVTSSLHIAQMQVGLAEPLRLAQGKTLRLRIFAGRLPMQCDGEAWQQGSATVSVIHKTQATMLSLSDNGSTSPAVN